VHPARTGTRLAAPPAAGGIRKESSWGKGRPAREDDSFADICEPIV
jgi:hypothetical protein